MWKNLANHGSWARGIFVGLWSFWAVIFVGLVTFFLRQEHPVLHMVLGMFAFPAMTAWLYESHIVDCADGGRGFAMFFGATGLTLFAQFALEINANLVIGIGLILVYELFIVGPSGIEHKGAR